GDEILYIIARHRIESGAGCSGVVGTQMSNLGLELALKDLGVPFVRTRVGDRYVIEAMRGNGWLLGGENSGHIVCSDLTTTGDGLVSALQVLQAMVQSGKSLADWSQAMHKFPQVMINVRLREKIAVDTLPEVQAAVRDAERQLADQGRVLLR